MMALTTKDIIILVLLLIFLTAAIVHGGFDRAPIKHLPPPDRKRNHGGKK